MKKYQVEITSAARKQIKKIPRADKEKILDKIESLAMNPRPHGYKNLASDRELLRVRVGNYRIIYAIYEETVVVNVLRVADRREAYR